MYKLIYKFGLTPEIGEKVSGDNEVRLRIEFTVNDTGTDVNRFSKDYGLRIISHGEIEVGREVNENLLVAGEYSIKIVDELGEFYNIFFSSSNSTRILRNAEVILEIKYYGTGTYQTEYMGEINTEDIRYDKKNKIFDFTALPRTDILKGIYLYKEVENGSRLQGENPLGISYSVVNDIYTAVPIGVKELVHRIFRRINNSCSFEWKHSWEFGSSNQGALHPPAVIKKLDELEFSANYLSALFFSIDNLMQIETLYDLLKKLSFSLGFMCGMLHSGKAFVRDLYSFNELGVQAIGRILSHKVTHPYGDTEAVRITSRYLERNTSSKNAYRFTLENTFVLPENSELRGKSIIEDESIVYGYDAGSRLQGGDLEMVNNGVRYFCNKAKCPFLTGSYDLVKTIVAYYYNMRNRNRVVYDGSNSIVMGRVDELEVTGINYDYTKDVVIEGEGYQILRMKKKIDKNRTELKLLRISEKVNIMEPIDVDTPPKPFMNVLPGGYMREYSYNTELKPEDINSGGASMYVIPAGFELKKIIIKINAAFNNLVSFGINDSEGVLIPSERIIEQNVDDTVIEVLVYKNYGIQSSITASFTKSGICTNGDADIILELRTRL